MSSGHVMRFKVLADTALDINAKEVRLRRTVSGAGLQQVRAHVHRENIRLALHTLKAVLDTEPTEHIVHDMLELMLELVKEPAR